MRGKGLLDAAANILLSGSGITITLLSNALLFRKTGPKLDKRSSVGRMQALIGMLAGSNTEIGREKLVEVDIFRKLKTERGKLVSNVATVDEGKEKMD